MKGSYRIIVQNKRIRYDFEIRRNITIIKGDSATGKTTLIDMIGEYDENGPDSGIDLQADKECVLLEGKRWKSDLADIKDSIVFIDEGNEFVFTDEFAAAVQDTDNYYVIATREGIPSLPYSIEEIYGIRNSGKYGTLKRTYNEFFHLYPADTYKEKLKPDVILTEDSNSGNQFFKAITEDSMILCESADGKSNIFSKTENICKQYPDANVLAIADGAAFGAEMEKMISLMADQKKVFLYLPESFEWIILKAGVLEDREIKEILAEPEKYIESQKYFSWERFFTDLLIHKTENTYLKYGKRLLNPAYLNEKIQNKIIAVMENIIIQ